MPEAGVAVCSRKEQQWGFVTTLRTGGQDTCTWMILIGQEALRLSEATLRKLRYVWWDERLLAPSPHLHGIRCITALNLS
jgi:hypothetical protein